MALIQCPECTKEISDKAGACPHCGNPMSAPAPTVSVSTAPGKAVTTESTSKGWKIIQLIGALLMIGGVVSCSTVLSSHSGSPAQGMYFFVMGMFIWLFGRFGAWWNHG